MILEHQSKYRIKLIFVAVLLLLLGVAFFAWSKTKSSSSSVGSNSCTQEAKLCSDGSAVGRSGPDCEFALCPEEGDFEALSEEPLIIRSWYPTELDTVYIQTQAWPPLITVVSESYEMSCAETESESTSTESVSLRTVDGRDYCMWVSRSATAGTFYERYVYSTVLARRVVSLDFALSYLSCDNYIEPQKGECESERQNFDSDTLAHQIAENLSRIRNYEHCVEAGLPILKSEPVQCQAPDGRIFKKLTNATWDTALRAINACEVEQVFQAHSEVVDLTLKSGQVLTVVEPEIDSVFKVLETVEPQCGRILMGTE